MHLFLHTCIAFKCHLGRTLLPHLLADMLCPSQNRIHILFQVALSNELCVRVHLLFRAMWHSRVGLNIQIALLCT